ncbi:autotransporter strand-loop-strand O-heptosyltransferase [Trinickia dabaoshanensis]|uniref:Autotransporter strand-loop-strand O-heptosyltransferase n=1 Tax=Trinickia dabaoshanensis TaxID=564714 RepID=A0A2N7VY34_9BURK|nr:autotransporter strand-loop-strand O-heptosyltransferase [Trinickia dabaoshanensis]PMS22067.1 autotransporter strand-loop-strand O-heptosyltransferase [Trinickia dabaoshanensis]
MSLIEPVAPSAGIEAPKPAFPAPAEVATQSGPNGIRFDFNDGCRVAVPAGGWRVRLRDIDTDNVLFETELEAGWVMSTKKYYVRFCIEVEPCSGAPSDPPSFVHRYDAAGQQVLIQFPVGTIGDVVGWLPYAVRFQRRHGCRLTCAMSDKLIPLFAAAYPDIEFITHEQVLPERFYATYNLGLYFDDADFTRQPCDFRLVGLHRTAAYILGVDPEEDAPRLALADESRPIEAPYVAIAVQSSTQAKYWNHPTGWREVVAFLKDHGYRVVCIDQKPTHGVGYVWNHIPYGAEDETGDRPLQERARWLRHASLFIGLSSGLTWLAWASGTPTVLISGFTHATNEFTTPFRVINYHACNSCWNDVRQRFDHQDFFWCPRHKGTPRQFECTRLITPEQVKSAVKRVPGFANPPRQR